MKKTSRILLTLTILGVAFAATISHQLGDRLFGFPTIGAAARAESYDLRSLKILASVLLKVQGGYLDQDKIDARKMLMAGLEKVSALLPEVVVQPAPGENEDNPAAIKVTVGTSSSLFDIGSVDTLWSMREKLKDIIGYIQDHLQDSKVKLQEVEYATINGILSTLDPHSVLLDPDMYKEMKVGTHGEFGGLGIVISIRKHELTIISPLEDTPAWRAGLKSQDIITQIDDESTVNMRLDDAVGLLRGKAGTTVTIWVKRKGWPEPRRFALVREKITVKSVASKLLGNGIGYVKLKNFQSHSKEQIKEHLEQMRTQYGQELRGVILDIRGNPGGLLEQAIKVSDLFLESGTIVLTVGKGNTIKEEHKASWNGTEKRYPMVVLVGPGSASASEIVAGALQNNDRALVIGQETFGKGSVQVLFDMPDSSALKLTIAQYLTPGEVSIQGVGIQPDIKLLPVTIEKKRVRFYVEEHFAEGDLETHLTNDAAIKKTSSDLLLRFHEEPPPEPPKDPDKDPPPPEDEDKVKEDFAIRFAQGLLAATKVQTRGDLLREARGHVARSAETELQTISTTLEKFGVDWSAGPVAPGPRPSLTLTTDRPGHLVLAGETIVLRATVKNTGNTPIHRLRGVTEAEDENFDEQEFVFGKLLPGQERTWEVPIELGKQEQNRTSLVYLNLFSGDGPDSLGQAHVLVEIKELQRPQFAYTFQLQDEKTGNGDGLIQRGERCEMRVFLTNTGPGKAQDIHVTLTNQSGDNLFLEQGRHKIDALAPGEQAEALFRFQVKRDKMNEEHVKLTVAILDMTQREGLEEELQLPVLPETKVRPLHATAVVGASGADVRIGASAKMPLLLRLKPGRALPALAQSESKWIQVDLGGRVGWVEASRVLSKDGRPATRPELRELGPLVTRMAPVIRFAGDTLAQKVTDQPKIRISGEAVDDQQLRDLYVYTLYRKGKTTKSKKLFFQAVDAKKPTNKLSYSLEVDLVEGANTITVVARDSDQLTAVQRFEVLRTPPLLSAEK